MQRTLTAARIACSAILLAGANNQGVELIIQRRVAREASFKEPADFFVALRRRGGGVPREHPRGVGANPEYRGPPRVERDGARRFGANAMNGEQFFAQRRRWRAKHSCQRTAVLRAKKAYEAFQFLGLLAEVAGRAYEPGQARQRNGFHGWRRQQFFAAQIPNGRLNIGPRSVLRKNGADDHLNSRAAQPPMPRPMPGQKSVI